MIYHEIGARASRPLCGFCFAGGTPALQFPATENARLRAEEFAKVGKVKAGPMRSASQGAFYILPANSDAGSDDYGGVYDKSTVEKKARVVVTIEYGIE